MDKIAITYDEIRESNIIEHDQKFVFIEDHLNREDELVKFCIKYFSLNVSAISGEHIPKVEKFKKELKAFMDAR